MLCDHLIFKIKQNMFHECFIVISEFEYHTEAEALISKKRNFF